MWTTRAAKGAEIVEISAAGEGLRHSSHRRIAPTLIWNPTDDMKVMQEEIFGPLLPIKAYQEVDDAIDYINAHDRPLASTLVRRGRARSD